MDRSFANAAPMAAPKAAHCHHVVADGNGVCFRLAQFLALKSMRLRRWAKTQDAAHWRGTRRLIAH
jgi:hypothetical protein